MYLDHLTVDQRHIFDEQAEDAFPLARFDGRIIPYARKIRGQGEQLIARLGIYQQTLLLCLVLVLFLRLGQACGACCSTHASRLSATRRLSGSTFI